MNNKQLNNKLACTVRVTKNDSILLLEKISLLCKMGEHFGNISLPVSFSLLEKGMLKSVLCKRVSYFQQYADLLLR